MKCEGNNRFIALTTPISDVFLDTLRFDDHGNLIAGIQWAAEESILVQQNKSRRGESQNEVLEKLKSINLPKIHADVINSIHEYIIDTKVVSKAISWVSTSLSSISKKENGTVLKTKHSHSKCMK